LAEYELTRRLAVRKAAEQIKDGYVVGLGSGSTIADGIAEIAIMMKERNLKALFIPTSHQIELAAVKHGLKLGLLTEYPEPDLAIDGADQVDEQLNLIKGGGAALMREKVVDASARRLLIVVDERKLVKRLGEQQPLPLEVLPFAHQTVMGKISKLGGRTTLREGKGKVGPIITDNGNFIVDSDFGPISDPQTLERQLKSIPGIIETGLFIDMVHSVYVARRDGSVQVLERRAPRPGS
jgi:ribose 5-phosphate isomerase A